MQNFSQISMDRLDSCHIDLQKICCKLINDFDFSIDCGARDLEQQKKYVENGTSTTLKSKHLETPSRAIDICPYPRPKDLDSPRTETRNRFYFMAGMFCRIAHELEIKVRWGGDWNMNNKFNDQSFYDLFHFELL